MTEQKKYEILKKMHELATEFNKESGMQEMEIGIGVVAKDHKDLDYKVKAMALIISEGNRITKNRHETKYESLEQEKE